MYDDTFIDELPKKVVDALMVHGNTPRAGLALRGAWRALQLQLQQQQPAASPQLELQQQLAAAAADADQCVCYLHLLSNTLKVQARQLGIPKYTTRRRAVVSTLCNLTFESHDTAIAYVVRDSDRVLRSFGGSCFGTGKDRAFQWAGVYDMVMQQLTQDGERDGVHVMLTLQLDAMAGSWKMLKHYELCLRPSVTGHVEVCNVTNGLLLSNMSKAEMRTTNCPIAREARLRNLYGCVATLMQDDLGVKSPSLVGSTEAGELCTLDMPDGNGGSIHVNVPMVGKLLSILPDGAVLSSDLECNADVERRILAFLIRLDRGRNKAVLSSWRWDGNAQQQGAPPTRVAGRAAKRAATVRSMLAVAAAEDDAVVLPPPPTTPPLGEMLQCLKQLADGNVVDVYDVCEDDEEVAMRLGRLIGAKAGALLESGMAAIQDVWRMTNGMMPTHADAERMVLALRLFDLIADDIKPAAKWLKWRMATEPLC